MATTISVWDYVVFGLMLALSSAIGIYYGCKRKQSTTTQEYLTASGKMHWFPISISLLASFVSAIALLGLSSEVYTFGIQHVITGFGFILMMMLSAWIYAPIFYRTKVTSANEYLEKRFGPRIRLCGCFLFILQYTLYLAVVIFAPSLALEAVAGVPLAASIITTGAVCTFYTTLGGMRGVVWTDVLQAFIMLLGVLVVIGAGTKEVGGVAEVFDRASKGQRLVLFDFNPDPTVRNTFWSLFIGGFFSMVSNWTTSQLVVQRFLSASSLKNVRKALYYNIILLPLLLLLCCSAGLVMYAVYGECDPRSAKYIQSNDQIIPYFVIKKLSHLTGVTGLYMACLFSGSLSTASSGLNSLTAVTLEDIVKRMHPTITDARATVVSKLIVLGYGVLIVSLAFAVSGAGAMILQLAFAISGVVGAPNFGMFTLGMLVPKANAKGVGVGLLIGLSMSTWISLGAIMYPPNKNPLPVSIAKCPFYNGTVADGIVPFNYKGHDFPLAKFYSLSQYWYGLIGAGSTFFIGWLASVIFNKFDHQERENVDPILLFNLKKEIIALFPKKCCPGSLRDTNKNEDLYLTDYKNDEKDSDTRLDEI